LAKKQKKAEIKRTPTKRQLSRWQRQKRIQRIIVISAAVFFALVVGFILYGYVNQNIRPLNQPVLKVNDTTFDMRYYLDMLSHFLEGTEPSQASLMANMVLASMLRNEIIIQYSADLGITISDDEIEDELKKLDIPNDKVRRDAYAADTLAQRLLSEYFESQVPEKVPQVKVEALCVQKEEDADEVRSRLDAGVEFGVLAEELSVEPTTKGNAGDLGWLPEGYTGTVWPALADSMLENIAFSLAPGVLSEPIYDPDVNKTGGFWIIEVIERDEDKSSHVRGILLGSLEKANDVKASLEAGEDFAKLAEELSEHSASAEYGGDLGWIQKDSGDEVITELAFTLQPGVISEPTYDETVLTKGAYWLVEVLDKENEREIDTDVRNRIKNEALYEWINQKEQASSVEYLLTEQQKAWAIDRITK
jgi:parvulin-like peptidyl-prolyl isomerase